MHTYIYIYTYTRAFTQGRVACIACGVYLMLRMCVCARAHVPVKATRLARYGKCSWKGFLLSGLERNVSGDSTTASDDRARGTFCVALPRVWKTSPTAALTASLLFLAPRFLSVMADRSVGRSIHREPSPASLIASSTLVEREQIVTRCDVNRDTGCRGDADPLNSGTSTDVSLSETHRWFQVSSRLLAREVRFLSRRRFSRHKYTYVLIQNERRENWTQLNILFTSSR